MASFRLNKVAKDFNVGVQTLVEYLAKKGHQVEASPNTKISEEQYELLATAFQDERKVKEEADKIELMTSGANRVVEASSRPEPESEPEEVVIKTYKAPKAVEVVQEEVPEPVAPEEDWSCTSPGTLERYSAFTGSTYRSPRTVMIGSCRYFCIAAERII